MLDPKTQIDNYVRACFPYIYVTTWEEGRMIKDLKEIANEPQRARDLFMWSITQGISDLKTEARTDCTDPIDAIDSFIECPNSICCFQDIHPFFRGESNPTFIRKFRDIINILKKKKITIIFTGPYVEIPKDLSKEVSIVEYPLPKKVDFTSVIERIAKGAKLTIADQVYANGIPAPIIDKMSDAALGLTLAEAENAMALAVIETKVLDADVVAREKMQAIRKSGLLEIWDNLGTLDEVGGLQNLKRWLKQRQRAFTPEAAAYNLPTPKGVLIVGLPGTGKSLIAKACAATWGRPLLRLDAGRIFGGLVGESERNLREIIRLAEAVSPVCLLIDEIEKAFSSGSDGSSDGGTSARVFGSLLTWMEEKTAPVFVVATANEVSSLPPELLRKGRFDELWWSDLPDSISRQEILKIHLKKRGRDAKKFDLQTLAKKTLNFSGAELESVVVSALFDAFDEGVDITTAHLVEAAKNTRTLAETAKEKISRLRDWAKDRTRSAALDPEESGERFAESERQL